MSILLDTRVPTVPVTNHKSSLESANRPIRQWVIRNLTKRL